VACSGIERCHDGVDNDCDGLVDCADPDCADYYLCPHSCPELVLPAPFLDPPCFSTHQWETSDQHDDTTGSCGGAGAPDIAFLYTASADGLYTFDASGLFDTSLYVLDGANCDGAELACNDNQPGTLNSLVHVQLHAGQQVVVVLDGASTGDVGRAMLSVCSPRPDAGTP